MATRPAKLRLDMEKEDNSSLSSKGGHSWDIGESGSGSSQERSEGVGSDGGTDGQWPAHAQETST